MLPLSFDNGWTDRNSDCCVNKADEKIPMTTNLVNLDPATPEIMWLICLGVDFREAKIGNVLVKGHSLGPTVFRGPRNFKPSHGIWPLPRNFRISTEFHGILSKHGNSEATANFRKSVLL